MATLTELTPATARRLLHTLESLGYIGRNGRSAPQSPRDRHRLSQRDQRRGRVTSVSPGRRQRAGRSLASWLLDDVDIVYIAHASLNRAIRLTAGAGSRYPVHPTSMGCVSVRLPAALGHRRVLRARHASQADRAHRNQPRHAPPHPEGLSVRAKGYAAIQDQLDHGIVSVSLPTPSVRRGASSLLANCSDVTNRLDRDTMIKSGCRSCAWRCDASKACSAAASRNSVNS